MSKTTMQNFGFVPAVRAREAARVALVGPAGAGKTPVALDLARELAGEEGRIAVVDSERGGALRYAEIPGRPEAGGHRFSHLTLERFTRETLLRTLRAAAEDRYQVLVVDSYSAWWDGPGGLREVAAEAGAALRKDSRATSPDPGWERVNPIERQMLDALLAWPGHVVITLRTHTEYLTDGARTLRVGGRPIQSRNVEHAFPVVVDLADGVAMVAKPGGVRALAGAVFPEEPGREIAAALREELPVGVGPVEGLAVALASPALTYREAVALRQEVARRGLREAPVPHPATGGLVPLGVLVQERTDELRPRTGTAAPAAPAGQGVPTTPAGPAGPVEEGQAREAVARAREAQPDPTKSPALPQQLSKIGQHYARLNITEASAREVSELILGADLDAWPELTRAHAGELVMILQRLPNELALEEWLGKCRERDAARAAAAAPPQREEEPVVGDRQEPEQPVGAGVCATCPGRILPRPGRETPEQCAVCRRAGIPVPDQEPESGGESGGSAVGEEPQEPADGGDVEVVDPEEWPGRGEESQDQEVDEHVWIDPGPEPASAGEREPAMA
ncbi:hypothetical protein GCM10027160_24130 [Streptomyces calidiresistens]|uniref:AAA family ATPase n=1 Tax=Streptomyces calidiresistens TaxID=1485586 RepID=A0A7W3XXB5_9ACTN|nr:AAA family ATPase [Streptomyces calidiresistens]MBB0230631.1 AAA family ATPase [Streptomyces calidiresistens]